MPSESKPLLTAQTEKPNHYSYLKEFRVEQCPLFLQHKCTQHRPFTCFHWHFMNQRRRRPVRRRDGTFNYSADNYCTKYDETTGICPDGDECPFLHRTAGDTERRYHLRYYKTCMCVHDTDSRGYCVKNGLHCAFAHGSHDHRPPVYDIKEIQALEVAEAEGSGSSNGPNALDKERNLMNEDPKWQGIYCSAPPFSDIPSLPLMSPDNKDETHLWNAWCIDKNTNYVLTNYKTEPCKRPPRLCRQGYACPQYHNSKDKRRSPRKAKYRSTPCPNVKHGEEWGEPGNCDLGDVCSYCHTRTEQQFHPEIYKSTKCNDVQQSGYCPRGVFCAFAHVEQEMGVSRDTGECGSTLADILSNVLPPTLEKLKEKGSDSSNGGSSEVSESASTSSIGSNSSHSKAPGSQLTHKALPFNRHIAIGGELNSKLMALGQDKDSALGDIVEREQQRKGALCFPYGNISQNSYFTSTNETVGSVVGNALDDLALDDLNLTGLEEADSPSNALSVGLASSGLLGSSAPVNIPGSTRTGLGNFSPTSSSPLQPMQNSFLSTRFSQSETMDLFNNSSQMQLSSSASSKLNFSQNFFDLAAGSGIGQNLSPSSRTNHNNLLSMSPSINNSQSEVAFLREELKAKNLQLSNYEEQNHEVRNNCDAWQRKNHVLEAQLKDFKSQMDLLSKENQGLKTSTISRIDRVEISKMSLAQLKNAHSHLKQDLEFIETLLYKETAAKCMNCEEQNRTVTLSCNHFVVCSSCRLKITECPYCHTEAV